MAYDQAIPLGAGLSGPVGMPSLSGSMNMPAPQNVMAAASNAPATTPSSEAGPSPADNNMPPRYTAADYRNELTRARKARRRKILLVVFLVLVLVGAAAAAILHFGASARAVSDGAMEPVMSQGHAVVTVKAHELKTGHVVAYHDGSGDVKFGRIVAEPGNWVSVSPDGTVAVSEEALTTDSANGVFGSNASSITTREVPDDSYYVLGDAEDATPSGLTTESDFVSNDAIEGKAVATVWPITSLSLVS